MNVVIVSPDFPPNFYQFCVAPCAARVRTSSASPTRHTTSCGPNCKPVLMNNVRRADVVDDDQLLAWRLTSGDRQDRLVGVHNEFWWRSTPVCGPTSHPLYQERPDHGHQGQVRMKARFIAAGVPVRGAASCIRRMKRGGDRRNGLPRRRTNPTSWRRRTPTGSMTMPSLPLLRGEAADRLRHGRVHQRRDLLFRRAGRPRGNPVFYTAHVFSQGIMETVNEDQDLYYHSLREIRSRSGGCRPRALLAFDRAARSFRSSSSSAPTATRLVSSRCVPRSIGDRRAPDDEDDQSANQADLYQEWANAVIGGPVRTLYGRPYFCGFAGRKPWRSYRHSHDEIMAVFGASDRRLPAHEPRLPPGAGGRGYVAGSPELDESRRSSGMLLEPA